MANNSVQFNIKLNVDGKERIAQASVAVEQLREAVDKSKTSWANAQEVMARASFAYQGIQSAVNGITSSLNALTEESRQFGGAMAAANTMAGKSGKDLADLKAQVTDLAKEVPVARDELANGLYQVISNGVPEDNWLEYLRSSARASVGGIADLSETVKVTSTLIKNYGLQWSDAGSIQDKIQLTAKNSVTTFEELAQALPRVGANAATLGVSVDELMASFATLTGVSGNTAEVSTQLAAIFTALVKPSSEATEMAQQMGIQFDAAAIKAAGGMQSFLESLSKSVSEYAKANGMLEQEIYGKLFGSAESLRAINPLVGNLAGTFQKNVGNMKDSLGTMDAAYEQTGNTGAAQFQLLKNKLAEVVEYITSGFAPALPVLNITTQVSITVTSILTLTQSFKSLGLVSKATSLVVGAFGPILQVCSATMRGTAVSATTLKLAIRGLMIATAVGAAVAALTTVIERLMNTSEDATGKTETLKEAEQAYQSTAAQTKVSIDQETKKLHELIVAKKDTTQAVKDLNDKYGTVFGNHQTAADWYDVLTKKSQIYARQLGYEAQMKVLSTKLAEKQIQLQDNYDKRRDLWKSGGARQTTTRVVGTSNSGATQTVTYEEDTQAYKDLKAEARGLLPEIDTLQRQLNVAERKMAECASQIRNIDNAGKRHNETLKISSLSYNQVKEKIDEYTKRLGSVTNNSKEASRLNGILKQLQARKKELEKTYSGLDTSSGKNKHTTPEPKFYKNPTTRQQYEKNISYYTGKLTDKDTADNQKIRENIKLWQHKVDLIDLASKKQAAPTEIKTHDDTRMALEYLNFAHDKAAALGLDIQDINKKIAEVNLADAAIDRSPVLDSLTAIDNEIKYQQALKNTSSLEEQDNIDKEIKKLEALKQKRSELQKLQDRLADAQESFDNATTVKAKVDASVEIGKIQRQIDENTHGKLTIEADLEPTYIKQGSVQDKRQSYSNAQQKASRIQQDFEIGIIGKEEAQREINDLNQQLQKLGKKIKPIKIELDEKGFTKAMGNIRKGWGKIQGIGNGIQGITDALDGNKNAWQVVSGMIDSFISIADGIQGVVSLINTLTGATDAATASSVANTAETNNNTAASATNTAVKSGEAIANATASGAKLAFPYNLVAIAAGVAAVVAALAMISGAFAEGGVVGGNSPSGDKLLARVNSGEMILNAAQQARLFALANGAAVYGASAQVATNFSQGTALSGVTIDAAKLQAIGGDTPDGGKHTVNLRLRGRDLVGAIANETRSNRRRSNIRL